MFGCLSGSIISACSLFGITFGITLGITFGITLGITFGITFGMTIGLFPVIGAFGNDTVGYLNNGSYYYPGGKEKLFDYVGGGYV